VASGDAHTRYSKIPPGSMLCSFEKLVAFEINGHLVRLVPRRIYQMDRAQFVILTHIVANRGAGRTIITDIKLTIPLSRLRDQFPHEFSRPVCTITA